MVGSVPIWAKMSPKKGFDFHYKIYNLTFQKYLDNDKISLKSKKLTKISEGKVWSGDTENTSRGH